jgi:hypothetical protein
MDGKLRSFSLQGTQISTPDQNSITPNGEQGVAISISSYFDTNGLLWAVYPNAADASHIQGTGQLLVYDPSSLSQYIKSYNLQGDYVLKFNAPMVANGKVFVATEGQPLAVPKISPRLLIYAP